MPRKRELLFTQVGTETVVLTAGSSQAICLNRISSVIWQLCDGRSSVPAIAEAATALLGVPVDRELVEFALQELRGKRLLEQDEFPVAGVISRRRLVQRLGTAATLLLPIVSIVAIPKQAHASGTGGCVPADTRIQLAGGGWLSAADIRPGMRLRAFDAESCEIRDGRVESVRTVMAPAIHTLFTERGDLLQSSPSHLLIAGAGNIDGTKVANFRAGDAVMVWEAGANRMVPSRLTGIQVSALPCTVYQIEMASLEHTYVSAGLVSHNVYKDLTPGTKAQWAEQARELKGQQALQASDTDSVWKFDK